MEHSLVAVELQEKVEQAVLMVRMVHLVAVARLVQVEAVELLAQAV
jgi:lipoprotein NlpI